ncbi:SanA/YdcF family protein [[Clostridium] fimetarium]|uniref:Protein SanA, affects membrane permeability for vancomycin n=1 Tax=[Clostridium] fimetarium TaxID=99656 RepID=A0A1I0P8Q4_9FIRM|nr:ElyC/SanA/YdcF family protein [[Clostridium] fimetarium]SEW10787.1 protein SanA, affects membrane permeability for vancomycin [[Clostridium] fimetarium]
MRKRKLFIRIGLILLALIAICMIIVLGINLFVKKSVQNNIVPVEDAVKLGNVDAIIILGAGVWDKDTPSPMLNDRLLRGVELYKQGASPKILMSGDHGKVDYDEVNVMKTFAINAGIDSKDIFMDHAGFSTYESIYRAKEIFGVHKVIIVTQGYHLYRALYIAKQLGIEAYGVASDQQEYGGQSKRELREILARNKDFINAILKPKPTYGGEAISINGNGNVTNDK